MSWPTASEPDHGGVAATWPDAEMPTRLRLDRLETDRLVLRPRTAAEAGVYRQLWLERDPRVPAHRRIDTEGRPTVEDIASETRRQCEDRRPGLLAVERKGAGDVIGYCGLVFGGNGAADEPELAYELLRRTHGFGYATEAGGAVLTWASEAGYERLWATVRAWNAASRRVLEKLGFHETGQVELDAAHGDSLLTVRDPGRGPAPVRTASVRTAAGAGWPGPGACPPRDTRPPPHPS